MLKKQIAEINSKSDVFFRIERADALIDRELCSEAHGVVAVDSQYGRSEEDLACLRLWDGCIGLQKLI